MTILKRLFVLTAMALLTPAIVIAHHNAASHYLLDQKITVTGVVKTGSAYDAGLNTETSDSVTIQ